MPLLLKPRMKSSAIDLDAVNNISEKLNISKLFAQVLYVRGFDTADKCSEYLSDGVAHDPFDMLNMDKLTERIRLAVQSQEKICIYGDYDVDGVCACTILSQAIKSIGGMATVYIPDRHQHGYGLNSEALEEIFFDGAKLVITVDCGIASADLIEEQIKRGREIIVTDHHTIPEKIPECLVVKPGQPGDNYKNADLCGAGIAFKIAQALLGESANELIDHAAVATVADIVPLTGENRYIVKEGLKRLNKSTRPCYKTLLERASFNGEITAQTIGYTIAPRINSSGRMATAYDAFNLLNCEEKEIFKYADKIVEYNELRQKREAEISKAAEAQICMQRQPLKNKVIVAYGKGWEEGVIGICAARLTEKYHRPSIVFSITDNVAKGSARSIAGIDIYDLLANCGSEAIIQFGGHKMAGGLSVKADMLEEFALKVNKYLEETCDEKVFYPIAEYDCKAKIKDITLAFCKEINLLQPCGCGNKDVSLRIDSCTFGGIKKVGAQKNHLKLTISDDSASGSSIAFGYEKHDCDYLNCEKATAIVVPEINVFRDIENVSLRLENAKVLENINPGHHIEMLTASFFRQLAFTKTKKAKISYFDSDDASIIAKNEVSGTLVICNHPEYAKSCLRLVQDEMPRFDVCVEKPTDKFNGYNTLVFGLNENIDFSIYDNIIIYGLINEGYADFIASKTDAEISAVKGGRDMFDTLFEEYKNISRDEMLKAYKAICCFEGKFEDELNLIKAISSEKGILMSTVAIAIKTFCELGFISVKNATLCVNKNAPRKQLEESVYYSNLLKCI